MIAIFFLLRTLVFGGELYTILLLPLFGTMVGLTSLISILDRLVVLLFGYDDLALFFLFVAFASSKYFGIMGKKFWFCLLVIILLPIFCLVVIFSTSSYLDWM
jgi:hypothetical protein